MKWLHKRFRSLISRYPLRKSFLIKSITIHVFSLDSMHHFLMRKARAFVFQMVTCVIGKEMQLHAVKTNNISYLVCMTNTLHSKDSISTFSRTPLLLSLSSSVDTRQYSRAHIQGLPHLPPCPINLVPRENQVNSTAQKRFPRHYNFYKRRYGC